MKVKIDLRGLGADSSDLKVNCPSCNGTGLYQGFFEDRDMAVPCWTCNGEGYVKWVYMDIFEGRLPMSGVKHIYPAKRHSNDPSQAITLEEFLAGKRPKNE